MSSKTVMTPEAPGWEAFVDALILACNVQSEEPGVVSWKCQNDFSQAQAILSDLPDIDSAATLEYFKLHGAFCDCEILWYIAENGSDPQPYIAAIAVTAGNAWPTAVIARLLELTALPDKASFRERVVLRAWVERMVEAGIAFTQTE